MKSYLVESYVARSPTALEDSRERARKTAEFGAAVLYVRSTYLPADELALHLFEAPSIEALEEAGRRAALDFERIVEAVDSTANETKLGRPIELYGLGSMKERRNEQMKTHSTKALLAVTATVLGAAALAVSALADVPASGHLRPDDRAGIRGPAGPDAVPVANVSVRPDDRAGVRGSGGPTAGAVPNVGHIRPDDRADPRGTGLASAPIATPVVVHITRPDFDWGDAGLGAAAGAGVVLLLFGASLLVRHARTEPRPV